MLQNNERGFPLILAITLVELQLIKNFLKLDNSVNIPYHYMFFHVYTVFGFPSGFKIIPILGMYRFLVLLVYINVFILHTCNILLRMN
jgi:hypothetical protein